MIPVHPHYRFVGKEWLESAKRIMIHATPTPRFIYRDPIDSPNNTREMYMYVCVCRASDARDEHECAMLKINYNDRTLHRAWLFVGLFSHQSVETEMRQRIDQMAAIEFQERHWQDAIERPDEMLKQVHPAFAHGVFDEWLYRVSDWHPHEIAASEWEAIEL